MLDMDLPVTPNYLLPKRGYGVTDEKLLDLVAEHAEALDAALVSTKAKLSEIRRNPNLSPLGVKTEAADAVRRSAAELMGLEERQNRLRKAIEIGEGRLLSPQVRRKIPTGMDPDDARAIEAETRQRLYNVKPRAEMTIEDTANSVQSREDILEQAAKSGDVLTMRAIELAPPAFPVVSEEAIETAASMYAEHLDPEAYSTLVQQRATLTVLEVNSQTAMRAFEHMAQIRLGTDEIAEAAGLASA